MAKSAWKFFNLQYKDIYLYLNEYKLLTKNQGEQDYGFASNSLKLNSINYMHTYKFHQGNCYVIKKFTKYSMNGQVKDFLKFKKPFYFHSKKKKKING